MIINGRQLASEILNGLKSDIYELKNSGKKVGLCVILVGRNPDSLLYVKNKAIAAKQLGIAFKLIRLPTSVREKRIIDLIDEYNNNPDFTGLILQRPLPGNLKKPRILNLVNRSKDIDGLSQDGLYSPPVTLAVDHILKYVFQKQNKKSNLDFNKWLSGKNITVIGRGETAGLPITNYIKGLLNKYYATSINQIISSTPNPKSILLKSDIIISCVGKPGIVKSEFIKSGSILISVGLWRDKNRKWHGDYEASDISSKAAYYTTTPGGVGPLNVAMLMKNVVKAAQLQN